MSEQIDLGVVGLGGWGIGRANTARDLGAAIVAGADVQEVNRRRFADEFEAATYEDHDELLENEHLDGIIVGTPNAFHAPASIAALERETAVYVAKPMADAIEAAKGMVAAERDSEAFGVVGYNNRYTPAVRLFKSHRADGSFGKISHVEAHMLHRRASSAKPGSWFVNERLAGGGALMDLGIHAIDLVLYLLDFPEVIEVTGHARTDLGDRDDYAIPGGEYGAWEPGEGVFDVEDAGSAFVRFEGGISMTLEVSSSANRRFDRDVYVYGTEAGAELSVGGDSFTILETSNREIDHHRDTELAGEVPFPGHEGAMKVFLDAIRDGTSPDELGFEEGLASMEIVDAIYRSSEQARSIRFDDRESRR